MITIAVGGLLGSLVLLYVYSRTRHQHPDLAIIFLFSAVLMMASAATLLAIIIDNPHFGATLHHLYFTTA